MFRHDYTPNRLELCKEAIINLVRVRRAEDEKTGFGLITVGTEIKELLGFDDFCDATSMEAILEDEIMFGGDSKVSDGIGVAIKMHIEDIRRSGAKVPKILVISDGKFSKTKVQPTKMAEIAKGLEIKIDSIRLGEVEHFNMLKRITELTEGKHFYCNDRNDVLTAAVTIAESNKGKKYQKSKNFGKILEKVAVELKTISELEQDAAEIAARIRGTASYKKCGICFKEEDPMTKSGFQISGRFCPNCGQGYHIHCMSLWASNDKDSTGTVVRCPHCFYLIKIPSEIQQAAKIREDIQRDAKMEGSRSETQAFFAKKYIAKTLGDTAVYSACPVCNTIFDEEEEVVKCGNPECNAIYHLDCSQQVANQPCKVCGKKMTMNF